MKRISSKTSLSSTTVTTAISKQELQVKQQQPQLQRSSLMKYSYSSNSNSNLHLLNNSVNNITHDNSRLDSSSTIQIDSFNNNYNTFTNNDKTIQNNINGNNQTQIITQTTYNDNYYITDITTPQTQNVVNVSAAAIEEPVPQKTKKSLLNFKSFDFHLKSLYSGLRNGNKTTHTRAESSSALNSNSLNNRMPPYLKIDSADNEESENLLLNYPQSPYSSRRNSDDNRSSCQLLRVNRNEGSGSQVSSSYFLSPHAFGASSGNIRRSSTSDIMSCKRSGSTSTSDSRRPSTSDLLRRARERKGSESKMGARCLSHGGLPRAGFRGGCSSSSKRRTSMAF